MDYSTSSGLHTLLEHITHTHPDSTRSSWATSSSLSKHSTQASLASSRTSYCSNASRLSFGQPAYSEDYHEILQESFGEDLVIGRPFEEASNRGTLSPEPLGIDKLKKRTSGTIQAACPWCAKTFTRRNDFRKHAHDFHLSRVVWQCRNSHCRERVRSGRDAKQHGNRNGSVDCKNRGTLRISLFCDKKHFGCPHCARYFNDANAYLYHLSYECCPGKAPRSAHQSLQMRGLLQQPELIVEVRNTCLRIWGDSEAYTKLWWKTSKCNVAVKIEELEYGIQPTVDAEHPGIAFSDSVIYLESLLSSKMAEYETVLIESHLPFGQPPIHEKPLPPTPTDHQPNAHPAYHEAPIFQQARHYLGSNQAATYDTLHALPLSVEDATITQPYYDPMIAGSFSSNPEEYGRFYWDELAEQMGVDPRISNYTHVDGFGSGLPGHPT